MEKQLNNLFSSSVVEWYTHKIFLISHNSHADFLFLATLQPFEGSSSCLLSSINLTIEIALSNFVIDWPLNLVIVGPAFIFLYCQSSWLYELFFPMATFLLHLSSCLLFLLFQCHFCSLALRRYNYSLMFVRLLLFTLSLKISTNVSLQKKYELE